MPTALATHSHAPLRPKWLANMTKTLSAPPRHVRKSRKRRQLLAMESRSVRVLTGVSYSIGDAPMRFKQLLCELEATLAEHAVADATYVPVSS
jgi:hypothetical protein